MENPRLTIFSLPKPFRDHVEIIQQNAVRNWSQLPGCEVILCGGENGVAEAAAAVGARHLPDIRRNDFGTPFLDDAFRQVAAASTATHLCYVNGDILFTDAPADLLPRVRFPDFLIVGRRMDLDVTESLDDYGPRGRADLLRRAQTAGILQRSIYLDYFIFPRANAGELPAFLVGRPGWDGWMVYNALKRGRAVIDATRALRIVHQNHGYGHVPQQQGGQWNGPEADWNRAQLDHPALHGYHYSTRDATHAALGRHVFPRFLPYLRRTARWAKKRLGLAYNPLPV